jgi:FKBP-type peptidyl-prolyl cis-trans isomerase FklB
MHEAMLQLGQELERRQQEQLAAQGERNLAEGTAFLESNRRRPGVVTLPSGLQYEVVRPGSDVRPGAADEVTVHYEGKLIDGTVFNTSYGLGRPMEATVNELVPGWQEALLLMGEGARWRIFLPPPLAYGDRSPSPLVGPNATLIFELELIAVRPR